MVHWLAAGWDVHLVSMSRGAVSSASVKLDGAAQCGYHGYTHNPVKEAIPTLTDEQIGEVRLLEARSVLGVASTITPNAGVTTGNVYHHEGNLLSGWTAADAQAVMEDFVSQYPTAAHHTMSPTDNHPDHAACGVALRTLKNQDPAARAGWRFFVSRLYWDYTLNPDVLAEAPEWFPTNSRKPDYDAICRRMAGVYSAWNPAAGSFAIGYHQVVNQFATCFPAPGSGQAIACLWHD